MDQGTDRKKAFRRAVYAFFSNDFMVLLAILLTPAIVFPAFFKLSNFTHTVLDTLNYFIIFMFTAEYCLKLYVAEERFKFVIDPWHILDLTIVVLALLDFVPIIPGGGRFAPVLRLARVIWIFVLAGRTARRAAPRRLKLKEKPAESLLQVRVLDEKLAAAIRKREDFPALIKDPAPIWIDLRNFSEYDLDFVCETLCVPKFEIQGKILKNTFPQIDFYKGFTSILINNTELMAQGERIQDISIAKDGILILCVRENVVTISAGSNDLFDRIARAGLELDGESFVVRVLYSILKLKNHDYEAVTDALEQAAIVLEEEPAGPLKKCFLEETFTLKREITTVHNNLRHLSQVHEALKRKKPELNGVTNEHLTLFRGLAEEAAYLHEVSDNIKERLVALIELYINTVSLDMNRVMRMLAIITCLGLIPSIIGALLGMNLLGNPWHASIYEICLLLALVLMVALYAFWKKGWFH